MMLSDATIRGLVEAKLLVIEPPPPDGAYQPASVDLCLGDSFINLHKARHSDNELRLRPGGCALGTTFEYLSLPGDLVARVEGKSSWGRRFLMVHSTAGFIDPGFCGQITLELKNLSPHPISISVGERIAQISFQRLDRVADRPYGSPGLGSHYQHQVGATAARD